MLTYLTQKNALSSHKNHKADQFCVHVLFPVSPGCCPSIRQSGYAAAGPSTAAVSGAAASYGTYTAIYKADSTAQRRHSHTGAGTSPDVRPANERRRYKYNDISHWLVA